MFTTIQKLDQIKEIMKLIETPSNNYYSKTDNSIRFHYRIGKSIKFFLLMGRVEVAEFLKTHGVITNFDVIGDEVKMFQKGFSVNMINQAGSFSQTETATPFTWEDIEFTPTDVKFYCAHAEFDVVHCTLTNRIAKTLKQIFFKAA